MDECAVDSSGEATRLLGADEDPPASVVNSGADSPFLLVGDHAGRKIPRALNRLGITERELGRHIACDLGVAGLGAALADRLGACFIAQRYSRLVIDCNRDPERADSIVLEGDGAVVSGNIGLSERERQARREAIFEPYHARIAAELDRREARGWPTILVALHSFTAIMDGARRPWRYGILHDGDSAFSARVLHQLMTQAGSKEVGDNQPYRMDEVDYTVPRHAIGRGFDYLELEVRQDLLGDDAAIAGHADNLAQVLRAALIA